MKKLNNQAEVEAFKARFDAANSRLKTRCCDLEKIEGQIENLNKQCASNRDTVDIDPRAHPSSYPAVLFVDHCIDRIKDRVERDLSEWCVNPAQKFPSYSLFPRLKTSLTAYLQHMRSGASPHFVETELARVMFSALKNAQRARVHID